MEEKNIIEKTKEVKEIAKELKDIHENNIAKITFSKREEISSKEMLELISTTNELKQKGKEIENLIITFGNMEIFQKYASPDLGVDYAIIPIYKNKGLRIIVEHNKIISSFCKEIEDVILREKFFEDNYDKLDECFSITFMKICTEKIMKLHDEEKEKILKITQKSEIQNANEAFELAQNLKKAIKREFGEDFTKGLFELMKDDYIEQIEEVFFNYIIKNNGVLVC